MKKLLNAALFLGLPLSLMAQEKPNVIFKLQNGGADSVLIGYSSESDKAADEYIDTAVLQNGELRYNMKFKGFVRGVIIPFSWFVTYKSGARLPGGRIDFYMNEGDQMHVEAKRSGRTIVYTATGNAITEQMAYFNSKYSEISEEEIATNQSYYDLKVAERTPEIQSAFLSYKRKKNQVSENHRIQYARENPGSEYAARLLLNVSNKDSILQVYPTLSAEVKGSFFGKILTEMVDSWFLVAEGKVLPSFDATTIAGKTFKLSEQRAKFILLDFWGSWCLPCLAEAPEMRLLAKDFKQDLLIVGLIANDTKEHANAAIKKHRLDWTHLYSDQNEFGRRFGVRGYPHKILLDNKGVVLKVITGTSEKVFADLRKILGR